MLFTKAHLPLVFDAPASPVLHGIVTIVFNDSVVVYTITFRMSSEMLAIVSLHSANS